MNREYDCDSCAYYNNGRCEHDPKGTYYPCPFWMRSADAAGVFTKAMHSDAQKQCPSCVDADLINVPTCPKCGYFERQCMKYDPLEYIRNYYGVPAKKGKVVSYDGRLGVITGASGPHVKVRLEGQKYALPYHPSDLIFDGDWLEGFTNKCLK